MRYYAQYNESGKLIVIGTGCGGVEITEAEYNSLLAEIREKAALVEQLYNGEITIDDVPTEWQEEIQRRVNERIAAEGAAEEQDLSAEEALNIILGGGNFATGTFTPETDISCSAQQPFVVQHNLGRIPKAFFMYVSSRGVWGSDSYNILFAFGFEIDAGGTPTVITTGFYSNDSANEKLKNANISYGRAYKANKTLQTANLSNVNNCISVFGATEETINIAYITSPGGLKGGWTYTWIAV